MKSILDRYFLRELGQSVSVTAIVLLLVMAGTGFARVLKQVASGMFPASVMFKVLALNTLDGLPTVIMLGGFIGVLLALGRMYRESAMQVLASSGMGPAGLLRPVALLSLLLSLLVAMTSLWLGPWSAAKASQLVASANRSMVAAGLDAGRFTDLPGRDGIILVDSLGRDGHQLGRSLIITSAFTGQGGHRIRLITSASGRVYRSSSGKESYLSLQDGWQYEIPLDAGGWRRMRYQRNDTRLSNTSVHENDSVHALTSFALIHSDKFQARAELAWRLVAPVMVWVLMMLALPMARQHPREAQFGRMLLAVLVFYAYYLALALCRDQISKGHWHHSSSLWYVSALLFACAVYLFRRPYVARRPVKERR